MTRKRLSAFAASLLAGTMLSGCLYMAQPSEPYIPPTTQGTTAPQPAM